MYDGMPGPTPLPILGCTIRILRHLNVLHKEGIDDLINFGAPYRTWMTSIVSCFILAFLFCILLFSLFIYFLIFLLLIDSFKPIVAANSPDFAKQILVTKMEVSIVLLLLVTKII